MLLTRKNILKQAVSRENMKRIQQAQNDSNLRTNHRMPRFQIDVAEVVHYANCLQTLNDRFNRSVRGFVNVKTIVYEDLLSDPRNEMKEVLQFLRMNPNTELVPSTYKATPDRLSEAVENYEDLVTVVAGTQLEQFLD